METYSRQNARRIVNARAAKAADDFHWYACTVPGSREYAVVSENQYSDMRRAGLIERAVYVQNGRGARLEMGQ